MPVHQRATRSPRPREFLKESTSPREHLLGPVRVFVEGLWGKSPGLNHVGDARVNNVLQALSADPLHAFLRSCTLLFCLCQEGTLLSVHTYQIPPVA